MAGTGNFAYWVQTPFMTVPENVEFHLTQPDDVIYDLLEENGLLTAGLETTDIQLYKATVKGTLFGVGGFEQYETDALLRSIVIQSEMRGQGYGTKVCLDLEDKIAESVCTAIYLRTTDAVGFFEKLGYESVDRDTAPNAIQRTEEFSKMCPSTDECMVKRI